MGGSMAMNVSVTPEKLAVLLGQILGRTVRAQKVAPTAPSPAGSSLAAIYETDNSEITTVCLSDLALAANSGAALCLIPPDRTKESIQAGNLEDLLLENFREVLNILSQLFTISGPGRVKLKSVCKASQLCAEASKLISSPARRLDMKLSIDGYGDGRMSVFS